MTNRANILVIDDHALFRSGVSAVIAASLPGVEVIEAGSLPQALSDAMPTPRIVLLDIQLTKANGLEGIAALRARWPGVAIVVVSAFDRSEIVDEAMRRGAVAFVSKTDRPERMTGLLGHLLAGRDGDAAAPDRAATRPTLTPRQTEVLDLVCRGLSNKMIGRRLGLSEHTVRGHVQAVLGVLNATNRGEAAFAARQLGLIR